MSRGYESKITGIIVGIVTGGIATRFALVTLAGRPRRWCRGFREWRYWEGLQEIPFVIIRSGAHSNLIYTKARINQSQAAGISYVEREGLIWLIGGGEGVIDGC
jgi:hypothetical protein